MIFRSRHAGGLAQAGGRFDESESLQTDVMRFMAILGLCLTAIFALVQSIAPRQQESANAQGHATEELASMTNLADAMRRELDQIEAELLQRKEELRTLRIVSAERSESLRSVSARLEKERKALERVEGRVRAIASEQTDMASERKRPRPAPEQHQAPSPGFVLRFASARSLDELVLQGAVAVYGIQGKQAWRLSEQDGIPRFTDAPQPGRYYEMSSDTVPDRYVAALQEAAQSRPDRPLDWGVVLPESTERQIIALLGRFRGGVLVINKEGGVDIRNDIVE